MHSDFPGQGVPAQSRSSHTGAAGGARGCGQRLKPERFPLFLGCALYSWDVPCTPGMCPESLGCALHPWDVSSILGMFPQSLGCASIPGMFPLSLGCSLHPWDVPPSLGCPSIPGMCLHLRHISSLSQRHMHRVLWQIHKSVQRQIPVPSQLPEFKPGTGSTSRTTICSRFKQMQHGRCTKEFRSGRGERSRAQSHGL